MTTGAIAERFLDCVFGIAEKEEQRGQEAMKAENCTSLEKDVNL